MSTRNKNGSCLQEDKLRSYLDGELSAAESNATAAHLKFCAACASSLEILRSDSTRLESLLASLAPDQSLPTEAPALLPSPQRSVARIGWTAALSLGALAAVIIAAVLLLEHRGTSEAPRIVTRQPLPSPPSTVATDHSNPPRESPLPRQVNHQQSIHPRPKIRNASLQSRNNQTFDHFIALDNDGPIDSGLIYRVDLPGSIFSSLDPAVLSSHVLAEVIVDGSGRARAFRFLGSQVKSSAQGE